MFGPGGTNPWGDQIHCYTSPGFFRVPWPWGGGGGGWKLPAAHKSKTIHGIDMEFGRGLENRKLINLA